MKNEEEEKKCNRRRTFIAMMMLHLMLFVFLSNILSFGCVDTYQIQTFNNSTFHHTKRSFADGKTNYPIPYSGEIRFPMYDGKEVIIEGVTTSSTNRFIVELCPRADCSDDKQMYMSVWKNTGKIQISSKKNDTWGPKYTFEAALLMTGTEIKIKLIIHDNNIKIAFPDKNGRILTTEKQQLTRWAEYFEETLNRPDPEETADFTNISLHFEMYRGPILEQEIIEATQKTKSNQAPG
ncbi:uncharacterized protein LOC131951879 [Physella acuta]|uniref:uncharacterized protein LOC131951879 n=1 Tax=Physella acuta TaxID=109671 RepID=UPI0027DE4D9A|nr:uncharacterized protein LOC131951879 [Physella acuta]